MSELPTLKIKAMQLELCVVEVYSDEKIADLLNRAAALGFKLPMAPSPFEELTLRELDILTQDTRGTN